MRRINSEFRTANMSEEGKQLSNRDYFGYVEMDDFACYVLADSLDAEPSANSARLVVESLIRDFTEAPSMGKRRLLRYIRRAHKGLLQQKEGMRLKASLVVAVTDYKKIRYAYAGNSRYYLIRSGRFLERTKDQSLSQNLMDAERLPADQVAVHEGRNNLYSFLGGRAKPRIQISGKKKLENGDIFLLLTRGIWERCPDEELLEIINNAKDAEEILNQTEDYILEQQESGDIDNYTLAVTFVNKVYQSPRKPWTFKKILLIVLPVVLILGGLFLGLYLRHRSIRKKEIALEEYMESGEAYLQYNNYPKAVEEYGEAKKLAGSLKKEKEEAEADRYKKLAEQIILADAAAAAEEYQKAQEMYLTAKELSAEAGHVGKEYIEEQLALNREYMEVFDLIALGEKKEAYGNLEGAIALYQAAKDKAAAIYDMAGKEEALNRQEAAEEQLETNRMKEAEKQKEQADALAEEAAKQQAEEEADQELENQQRANDRQSAIELENQGNELLAAGEYESAITFYQTAQAIYIRLELPIPADAINGKIDAARAGIAAAAAQKAAEAAELERQMQEAEELPDEAEEAGQ